MCKLHADLMMTPGIQIDFQLGKRFTRRKCICMDYFIMKSCILCIRHIFFTDTGGVGSSVLYKIVFQRSFAVFENA